MLTKIYFHAFVHLRCLETPSLAVANPETWPFLCPVKTCILLAVVYPTDIDSGCGLIQYRLVGNMPAVQRQFLAPGAFAFCGLQ